MNKNTPKESRERERLLIVLCQKNIDWMVEMISNLYKIKWEEEELKYKKERMMSEV